MDMVNPLIVPRRIFRAYDIRGNVDLLNGQLIKYIGFALAKQYLAAGQNQVVIGYDARLSSESYCKIIATSLQKMGIHAVIIGQVSTPLLYFTAQNYQGNGIMITASHNPVQDNGVKWIIQGCPPTMAQIQQIADYIEQGDFQFAEGTLTQAKTTESYYQYLQHDIQLPYQTKVCLEGLHGSAGAIAHQALLRLGCQVEAYHCHSNGHFPQGAPNPTKPQRLQKFIQEVKKHQPVIGIALDGDGDRVVILDSDGNIICPDRLMCLFSKMVLQDHTQAEVVCDVKSSRMIAQTAEHYGGRATMIRTGSSFLRRYLYQHNAAFGGEYAGHYVFNDGRGKGYDDGLYAALRLLEYLTRTQQTLAQALAEFPIRFATGDVYINCHNLQYSEITHCLEQYMQSVPAVRKSDIDGLRFDLPYGFGLIRPSNTGEYFTVRFEADNQAHLQEIQQYFVNALQYLFPQLAQDIAAAK